MDIELNAENITHKYNRQIVLSNISFNASKGEIIAVTGINGSGKSTLLRIISGLVMPYSGNTTLKVNGVITHRPLKFNVSIASPDVKWYPSLTLKENILFYFENTPHIERAFCLSETLGLKDVLEMKLSDFSSGMIQRFNIASALAPQSPLIILDEPSTHIDENCKEIINDLLKKYSRDSIIVIATHHYEEIELATGRVHLE